MAQIGNPPSLTVHDLIQMDADNFETEVASDLEGFLRANGLFRFDDTQTTLLDSAGRTYDISDLKTMDLDEFREVLVLNQLIPDASQDFQVGTSGLVSSDASRWTSQIDSDSAYRLSVPIQDSRERAQVMSEAIVPGFEKCRERLQELTNKDQPIDLGNNVIDTSESLIRLYAVWRMGRISDGAPSGTSSQAFNNLLFTLIPYAGDSRAMACASFLNDAFKNLEFWDPVSDARPQPTRRSSPHKPYDSLIDIPDDVLEETVWILDSHPEILGQLEDLEAGEEYRTTVLRSFQNTDDVLSGAIEKIEGFVDDGEAAIFKILEYIPSPEAQAYLFSLIGVDANSFGADSKPAHLSQAQWDYTQKVFEQQKAYGHRQMIKQGAFMVAMAVAGVAAPAFGPVFGAAMMGVGAATTVGFVTHEVDRRGDIVDVTTSAYLSGQQAGDPGIPPLATRGDLTQAKTRLTYTIMAAPLQIAQGFCAMGTTFRVSQVIQNPARRIAMNALVGMTDGATSAMYDFNYTADRTLGVAMFTGAAFGLAGSVFGDTVGVGGRYARGRADYHLTQDIVVEGKTKTIELTIPQDRVQTRTIDGEEVHSTHIEVDGRLTKVYFSLDPDNGQFFLWHDESPRTRGTGYSDAEVAALGGRGLVLADDDTILRRPRGKFDVESTNFDAVSRLSGLSGEEVEGLYARGEESRAEVGVLDVGGNREIRPGTLHESDATTFGDADDVGVVDSFFGTRHMAHLHVDETVRFDLFDLVGDMAILADTAIRDPGIPKTHTVFGRVDGQQAAIHLQATANSHGKVDWKIITTENVLPSTSVEMKTLQGAIVSHGDAIVRDLRGQAASSRGGHMGRRLLQFCRHLLQFFGLAGSEETGALQSPPELYPRVPLIREGSAVSMRGGHGYGQQITVGSGEYSSTGLSGRFRTHAISDIARPKTGMTWNEDGNLEVTYQNPKTRQEVVYKCSMDGAGGEGASGDGQRAMQIFGTTFARALADGDTPNQAIRKAQERLSIAVDDGTISERAALALNLMRVTYTEAGQLQADFSVFGDAKAVVLRPGRKGTLEVKHETSDQSFVNDLVQKGIITNEDRQKTLGELLARPNAGPLRGELERARRMGIDIGALHNTTLEKGFGHIITGSMGAHTNPTHYNASRFLLETGDIVIQASDGLWDFVKPHEVAGIIRDCGTETEAARALKDEAIRRMGTHGDNFNVIVTFVVKNQPSQDLAYQVARLGDTRGKISLGATRARGNHVSVEDPAVSATHATLSWEPDQEGYFLQDSGSPNGTFYEVASASGQFTRLSFLGETFVRSGQRIRLGTTFIEIP